MDELCCIRASCFPNFWCPIRRNLSHVNRNERCLMLNTLFYYDIRKKITTIFLIPQTRGTNRAQRDLEEEDDDDEDEDGDGVYTPADPLAAGWWYVEPLVFW